MRLDLTDSEKMVLVAMAKSRMRISRAAEMCDYSRQNIYYKLLKIEAKTGENPNSFEGLARLLIDLGYICKKCHYSNLQLLKAFDNLSKHDKTNYKIGGTENANRERK